MPGAEAVGWKKFIAVCLDVGTDHFGIAYRVVGLSEELSRSGSAAEVFDLVPRGISHRLHWLRDSGRKRVGTTNAI